MLDITKIEEAIDAYILTNPTEDYRVYIKKDDRQRPYLGLSGLGDKCIRKVWYQFRHCFKPQFPTRMLRLFRRGDREEFTFVWLLKGIGFEIHEVDSDGKQFSVSDFENHLKGNLDGVAKAPKKFWKAGFKPKPFLLEMKTVNDKGFKEFCKKGVKATNSKYYYQMQGYAGYENLCGALFCMVNKNTDELYFEWVESKANEFEFLVSKAEEIIGSQAPPEKLRGASASWFECRFCDAKDICHKGAASQKMCRTCRWASPAENAQWTCAKGGEYGTVCGKYRDIARG